MLFARRGATRRMRTPDVADGSREHTLYAVWSPEGPVSRETALSEADYARARDAMKLYWDGRLAPVLRFDAPEAMVMDAQRNLLIQNLIMRWRYSLGGGGYHRAFTSPRAATPCRRWVNSGIRKPTATACRPCWR